MVSTCKETMLLNSYSPQRIALLVDAACSGDRYAFDRLVEIYQVELRGFLIRRVNPSEVEDIVQEAFLAVWVSMPRLPRNIAFKTWLYSIAIRKEVDYYRRQKRCSAAPAHVLEEFGGYDNSLERFESREATGDLLSCLGEEQRQLLEMYYFEQRTLPEIATILRTNLNTIKHRFYQAHRVAARQRNEVL